MFDFYNFCYNCMGTTYDGVCINCGFHNREYKNAIHHLKPGTILNGKYIIGKSIGEGGFGITYVGYDMNLDMKVAIKEYFPSGFVSRDVTNTDTVTVFSGSDQEIYLRGRDKFINEAKILAKFENMQGIVSVKDYFMENGTAYITMEYIEGETLRDFLRRNGGKTDVDNILTMMKPVMESLSCVHRKGLIHRDISPDNIMITKDSNVKLIDFGAARDISADGQKSLSIQLKPGYAPEEQYRSHGEQGPWTDVYALCATIYRAITGRQPVESLERVHNDSLIRPSELGVHISPQAESVLMTGLEVFAQNRFQGIDALYNALYISDEVWLDDDVRDRTGYTRNRVIIILAAVLAIAAIVSGIIYIALNRNDPNPNIDTVPTESVSDEIDATEAPTKVPAPDFDRATASSTRGTDSLGGTYSEESVLTDSSQTKWAPVKRSNGGVGEWIEIYSTETQYVQKVLILNGYQKDYTTWKNNNRVRACTISFSNGESKQYILDDTMDMIELDLGEVIETNSVRLTIESIYKGDRWNDIGVTYLGAQ